MSKFGRWLTWLLALAFLPSLIPNPYVQYVVNISLILAFATIGLNVVFGFAGQHAFGHPVFFGVGAYASALLAVDAGLPAAFADAKNSRLCSATQRTLRVGAAATFSFAGIQSNGKSAAGSTWSLPMIPVR